MSDQRNPWVGRTVSHYEILAKIGDGGMGVVYKARDLRLGRSAALKFLPAKHDDPQSRQRFLQEAKAASSFDHPNICTVYEIDETGEGEVFFAMAFCEGETLREKIRRGPLKLEAALEYAIQICAGLGCAHAQGVVHRDIKPANLIVNPAGQLKIVDFGIARLLNETRLTRVGLAVGTAAYMSPEQILGEPLDRRTDVWSLGVVLFEMVTGHPPFGGDDRTVGQAILHADPRPLQALRPEAPAELARIIAKTLAKDPADRYQHVEEIAVDLRLLLRSLDRRWTDTGITRIEIPRTSTGSSRPSAARRWQPPGRKWLVRAAAAAALIGLTFLAGLAVARQTELFSPAATETAPTFKLLTYERGAIQRARFAPDGQTLLFGASWNGAPFRLFLTRPGSLLASPIDLPPADLLAVSPSGELAIAVDYSLSNSYNYGIGTLAVAPLLGGGARRLQERILEADFAPNGSGLAVVRGVEGGNRLEFPIGKVLYATTGNLSRLRFSRDGRRIAFFEHPPVWDWSGSLRVTDLQTGRTVKLSQGWISLRGLAWSPAGDEVWLTGSRNWNPVLSAVRLDGRERTLLSLPVDVALLDVAADGRALLVRQDSSDMAAAVLPGESRERDISWLSGAFPVGITEDGKTLLFTRRGPGSGPTSAVYLRDLEGTSSVLLGEGRAQDISPDGRWVASLLLGMPSRLLLLPVGAGQVRSLDLQLEAFSAGWFPDGRRLALTAREPGKPFRCYVLDLARGTPRAITPERMACFAVDTPVSPDGTAVVGWSSKSAAVFPVAGGPARPIPFERGDGLIRWDASGKAVFTFRRSADARSVALWKVHRTDVVTGERRLWKDIRPADPAGLTMQRVVLTADGETCVYAGIRTTSRLFLVEGLR